MQNISKITETDRQRYRQTDRQTDGDRPVSSVVCTASIILVFIPPEICQTTQQAQQLKITLQSTVLAI